MRKDTPNAIVSSTACSVAGSIHAPRRYWSNRLATLLPSRLCRFCGKRIACVVVSGWAPLCRLCGSFGLWLVVANWHPWLTFCDNSALSRVVAALLPPRNLLSLAVALAAFASRSALISSSNDIAPSICTTAGNSASHAWQLAIRPQRRPAAPAFLARPGEASRPGLPEGRKRRSGCGERTDKVTPGWCRGRSLTGGAARPN